MEAELHGLICGGLEHAKSFGEVVKWKGGQRCEVH